MNRARLSFSNVPLDSLRRLRNGVFYPAAPVSNRSRALVSADRFAVAARRPAVEPAGVVRRPAPGERL